MRIPFIEMQPPDDSQGSSDLTKRGSIGSRIVRLAHNNPGYRDDLQPLLYVVSAAKKKKEEEPTGRSIEQREFADLLTYGPRFGILSSQKGSSDSENKIRQAELISDLRRLGYRKISPLEGKWKLLPKNSIVIQNIRPEDLFELGRKYEQKFVIFTSESSLVGFYYLQKEPKARIIVDPKGDTLFRSLTDMTPYSRSRGLDVEFGLLWSKEFPWDGRSVMTRKLVRTLIKREGLKDATP